VISIFWSGSGGHRKLIAVCSHDCAIKYVTSTGRPTEAVMGGILKILILSEILPVYLVDRLLYLSVAVTSE